MCVCVCVKKDTREKKAVVDRTTSQRVKFGACVCLVGDDGMGVVVNKKDGFLTQP